ncbi:hypothetical protein Tco_0418861 [Tanacetum coccineum]
MDADRTQMTSTRLQKITSLKKRVKKLEKKGGSRTHKLKRLYKVGRSARVVSSDKASLGDQEDASKQGRKIHNIDADEDIILENVHDAEMFDVNDLDGDEVVVESEVTDKDGENRHIVEEAVVVTDAITILAQEQQELTIREKSTLFVQLLEKRKKHFATKRAKEKINRPPTRAQHSGVFMYT